MLALSFKLSIIGMNTAWCAKDETNRRRIVHTLQDREFFQVSVQVLESLTNSPYPSGLSLTDRAHRLH